MRAAERKLARLGVLDVLHEFMRDRPQGAYHPDFCDLLYLYEELRKRKPRAVLEFGSGCSTVVLAQALRDNERESGAPAGHLCSIDGEAFWAAATVKSLPAGLADLCDVVHIPARQVEFDWGTGLRHEFLPDLRPDFVYVDGPDPATRRETPRGGPLNLDVLELEANFPPVFAMVVDGRRNTVALLRRKLRRTYRVTERRRYYNTLFELDAPDAPL